MTCREAQQHCHRKDHIAFPDISMQASGRMKRGDGALEAVIAALGVGMRSRGHGREVRHEHGAQTRPDQRGPMLLGDIVEGGSQSVAPRVQLVQGLRRVHLHFAAILMLSTGDASMSIATCSLESHILCHARPVVVGSVGDGSAAVNYREPTCAMPAAPTDIVIMLLLKVPAEMKSTFICNLMPQESNTMCYDAAFFVAACWI